MRIMKSEQGPLWVAIAISIFVHLLILPSLKILKWHNAAPDVMTAILQPLPPAPKIPSAQARLSLHALKPVPSQRRAATKREAVKKKQSSPVKKASPFKKAVQSGHGRPVSRSVKPSAHTSPDTSTVSSDAGTKDALAKAATATAQKESGSEKTEKDTDKKPPANDAPHADHILPNHVQINYQIRAKGYVAHAKQEWRVTDGHYHISLQGSLRFLFFKLGAMSMSSDGQLDHGIPKPDQYVEDRNGHLTTATFTTDGGITIDQEGRQQTLKAGGYPNDLLSLAFVLAARPSVATGTLFTLVNRGEAEDLRLDATVGGQITVAGQTFVVQRYVLNRLHSAGGVEIWLAPELDEVPVSVIIRGRDGELTMAAERIGINEP